MGFMYEIWFDSNCLHEDDDVFETEDEVMSEATKFCVGKIEQWKNDGAYNGETISDFEIVIKKN